MKNKIIKNMISLVFVLIFAPVCFAQSANFLKGEELFRQNKPQEAIPFLNAAVKEKNNPQAFIERIVDVFPPHQQNQIRLQLAYTLLGICSQQLIPTANVKGRVCATEILITTPAIRASIREGKISSIRNALLTGMSFGMHTMEQDLVRWFKEGRITRSTAKDFAYDQAEIERVMSTQ